jgi:S-DNA-T family DNA segregation ATPase FtsK/SpoIIIE
MDTRQLLEYQADAIEAVLARHNAPGRVAGGTVTPRFVRFKVFPNLGTRISKVKGLSDELAAALDVDAVRIARQGAAVMVEVVREDARAVKLLPLLAELDDVPAVTAALGVSDDGAPLLIRLPSPDVAHVLIAGTTGSGKTVLLRSMVLSLGLLNPRRSLGLVLVDPRGGAALGCFAGLPHLVQPVITTTDDATETLGRLVALMEGRDTRGEDAPAVVVVIDELADLLMTGGDATEQHLTRLLQRGRNVGLHVIAATQKPTAAVIGTLIKSNFPVRIVGRVTSANDARVAAGWPGTGAERLGGRGDFIAIAEGRTHRFQAACITEAEILTTLAANGWNAAPKRLPAGGDDNGKSKRAEVVVIDLPPAPEPEPDGIEAMVERLRAAGWSPDWSYRQACRELGEVEGGNPFYNVQTAVDVLRATATGEGNGKTPTAPEIAVIRGSGSGSGWAGLTLAWEEGA